MATKTIKFNSGINIFQISQNADNGTTIQVVDENDEYVEADTTAAVTQYNEFINNTLKPAFTE